MGTCSRDAIREFFAELKIRLDRGNSLVYWAKNLIIGIASIKIIFNIANQALLLGIFFIAVIGIFLIGYLDIKYFRLFQMENALIAGKYNPFFKAHLEKI